MTDDKHPTRILLFLIYGTGREYHLELSYSILSAARFLKDDPAGVKIVLVADPPNQRPDLPVEHLVIDNETLNTWQMGGAYFHAAKPYALAHALRHFDAPAILVDSDTIFHAHPKRLFDHIGPGRSLMHLNHGRLDHLPNAPEWDALIESSEGTVAGWPIGGDTVIYNSGLLGLDPRDVHLMDDVISVMKAIRTHSGVFTAEQLAASIVFLGATSIATCEDIVEHYWDGPRAYYHYQMARMFPQVLSGGGVELAELHIAALHREPPVRLIDKMATYFKRLQRGHDGDYIYAYLAYRSARSCQQRDPELANVWADTALAMLTWGVSHQRGETTQDFSGFRPETLQSLRWMQPELRARWETYWKELSRL